MRGSLGWIAIGWLLLLAVLAIVAFGQPASRPTLDDRARAVAQQLRCPVCQGESVADSPSDIARAMRAEIRQRLREGQSPGRIERYFISKYGDWILLAPPQQGVARLAWIAPPLLVLGGIGLLLTLLLAWRGRQPVARGEIDQVYLERVRAEFAAGEWE